MSSAGVPAPSSSSAPSHTSTNQWQSFEMRMRKRRAERCVLRAEVALEAGFPAEAREALEEARRLDSSAPEFEVMHAAYLERTAIVAPPQGSRRFSRTFTAAAVLLLVGVGAFWWSRAGAPVPVDSTPIADARLRPDPAPAITQSGTLDSRGPQAPSAVPAKPAAAVTTELIRPEVDRASAQPRVESGEVPAVRAAAVTPEIAAVPLRSLPLAPAAHVEPPAATASSGTPESTAPPAVTAQAGIAAPLPIATATPTVPEAPAPPDERPRVRATLQRYEAAYSALNVDGVRAVWPGVDARALDRAFDGLASQRLSLGQCAMTIDGAAARAECRGTSTWAPKIGGGTQSANRAWTFELRNTGGAWQIVGVQAR